MNRKPIAVKRVFRAKPRRLSGEAIIKGNPNLPTNTAKAPVFKGRVVKPSGPFRGNLTNVSKGLSRG